MERVRIGCLEVDRVTCAEALDAVDWLIDLGAGGAIFTPNVDHVVLAEEDARFREAYGRASLSLADGMPVVWASRLLGYALPEKVSGSDFVPRLMERAAERGLRVYLLGGGPGAAERAAEILRGRGVAVCGFDAPIVRDGTRLSPIVERIEEACPDIVLVGLGAPKQELLIDAVRNRAPAVYVACGATIDFIAGNVKRAPRWMSASGLEWFYRLCREPRRLWRRYLVRDPKFVSIVWRQLRDRRAALPPQSAPGSA